MANEIQFFDDGGVKKMLFESNKIAFNTACCCDGGDCPGGTIGTGVCWWEPTPQDLLGTDQTLANVFTKMTTDLDATFGFTSETSFPLVDVLHDGHNWNYGMLVISWVLKTSFYTPEQGDTVACFMAAGGGVLVLGESDVATSGKLDQITRHVNMVVANNQWGVRAEEFDAHALTTVPNGIGTVDIIFGGRIEPSDPIVESLPESTIIGWQNVGHDNAFLSLELI